MNTPDNERRPNPKARATTGEFGGSYPVSHNSPERRGLSGTVAEEERIVALATFLGGCRHRRDDAAARLAPLADGRRDRLRAPTDGGSR